ncbi:MAG: serine/threonine protein kinase [bacterium]|nr:serine/threonine protein kinase [bacterium]
MMRLLSEAQELGTGARERFLANAGDPELRREVDAMLAGQPAVDDGFLEDRVGAGDLLGTSTLADVETPVIENAENEASPERLGPYRIVRALGKGGMGSVYLGEQEEPVRRWVALKIIDRVEDPRRLKRFASECQALARLSHPNVAALYEVGATEDQHPFVAMELVEGETITTWCDERGLSLRERLRLFLGVCAGIRHAHEKGILHRDLKPSNVLVTEVDGRPAAKVIDFGIAQALDEPLLPGTKPVTLENQIIGSLAYMSPEAAAGKRDLDTRSDVYSLGLVLYKLLVGELPVDSDGRSFFELLRRLAKGNLPLPSARFAELDAERRADVAARRHLSERRLTRRLRGDLDAIVAKAITRDHEQRYSSPADLAADLERHLAIEPIEARPQTPVYVTTRFVRRRLGVVVSVAALILALVAGVVASAHEARRANLEADRATRALAESQAVSEFLVGLFEISDPRRSNGEAITARELLDRGADDLRSTFSDQPLAKARFLGTIGTIYRQLGLYERGEDLLKQRLALLEASPEADDLEVALACRQLAVLYLRAGSYWEAEPLLRSALAVLAVAPDRNQLDLAETLAKLGSVVLEQGRFEEAEPYFQRALAITEEATDDAGPELARSLDNLGAAYFRQNRLDEAEKLRTRALAIREKTLGPDHLDVALSVNNVGTIYRRQGRLDEAGEHIRRALAIRERILGPDHPDVARTLNNLGSLYHVEDRIEEAEALLSRALEIKHRTLDPGHPSIANSLMNLAYVLHDLERYEEAELLERDAVVIREKALGPDHAYTASALATLATTLRELERYEEAERLYQRALDSLQGPGVPATASAAEVAADYAVLLHTLGRTAEADALTARFAQ